MKKSIIAIAAILLPLMATAQNTPTPAQYLEQYRRQIKVAGSSGLGVKAILDSWESAYPTDTNMLECYFSYCFTKARGSQIKSHDGSRYLGQKPVLSLKDSTGRDINYFEVPVYDEPLFAQSQKYLDRAITLAPDNLGYLFDEITSLTDFEGESPDMAATALLNLIDRNYSEHPRWNLDGSPITEEQFVQAVKEYCGSFFYLGTPGGYECFHNVSRRMLQVYPKDADFLNNVGAYWQVAQQNPKKAEKFYKKVLKMDPENYAAKRNMKIITKTKNKK